MSASVRVTVVTHRRSELLKRALHSLLAQTHPHWRAEIINDAPDDSAPAEIIRSLADPRLSLFTPEKNRGATANFNLAFAPAPEPFSALLEDDNWWQPSFLEKTLVALEAHPTAPLVCTNEKLWRENTDGTWSDTGQTAIAAIATLASVPLRLAEKCGHAHLRNSALLWRTHAAHDWQTPATIPVDVTEHYRERRIPHPFLQLHKPLVNYAQTLRSHRDGNATPWALHQTLLVGSVFNRLAENRRAALAKTLWKNCRAHTPLQTTTLLATGWRIPTARTLWQLAQPREKLRFLIHLARHPQRTLAYTQLLKTRRDCWQFLSEGWVAENLHNAEISNDAAPR